MNLRTEQDILKVIHSDQWMMEIIGTAASLGLKDWWVCAGFVRSKIWDTVHGYTERTVLSDIDVIFHDERLRDELEEKKLEAVLLKLQAGIPWSVKNQARMHLVNNIPPYESSIDAISKFPETSTALGVTMEEGGKLRLIAPHGIHDAVNLQIKPTPFFKSSKELMEIYKYRLETKNWTSIWPGLKVSFD